MREFLQPLPRGVGKVASHCLDRVGRRQGGGDIERIGRPAPNHYEMHGWPRRTKYMSANAARPLLFVLSPSAATASWIGVPG
jgi:hypothetical protein